MQKKRWIQDSKIIEENNETLMFHQKINNFVEVSEMSSYQLFESGWHTLNIALNCLKKENFEQIIKKSFNIIKIYNLEYNPKRHIYILEKI